EGVGGEAAEPAGKCGDQQTANDKAARAPEIGEGAREEAEYAGDAVEQRNGPARLHQREAELGRERRQRRRHLPVLERAENAGEEREEEDVPAGGGAACYGSRHPYLGEARDAGDAATACAVAVRPHEQP